MGRQAPKAEGSCVVEPGQSRGYCLHRGSLSGHLCSSPTLAGTAPPGHSRMTFPVPENVRGGHVTCFASDVARSDLEKTLRASF